MKFTFKLARRQITEALGHYQSDTSEMRREQKALQSGRVIASGDANPNHLEAIINWKSEPPRLSRRLHHLRGWSNGKVSQVFSRGA